MVGSKYYVKTLYDGRLAVYDKVTHKKLTECDNRNFLIAWLCREEDYDRKLGIIRRVMLCEHGLLIDKGRCENKRGLEEFKSWYSRLKFLDTKEYYRCIDMTYEKAMRIVKTYYKDLFDKEGYYENYMG